MQQGGHMHLLVIVLPFGTASLLSPSQHSGMWQFKGK
jgi:hypothetical protein